MRIFFLIYLAFPLFLNAQFVVAPYFSDNMVLQRDQPIHIWGKANPGLNISVSFLKQKKHTTVNADSSWNIYLSSEIANNKSNQLCIQSGGYKKVFQNVLLGDIWLCIGQSNMQFAMQQEMYYKEELKNANQPLLRFYNPTYIGKDVYNQHFTDSMLNRLNQNDFYSQASWNISDSQHIKNMSAVAYYFGKELVRDINIPIGLINLSIGGAPIETFINPDALKNDNQTKGKINGNWINNNSIPSWVRTRGTQNIGGLEKAPSDLFGPNHAFKPGFAFNAGIKPLTKFPIKGIIWYQGESNSLEINCVNEYAYLQKMMINDYRKHWKQPQLPLYWVQLSSIDTIAYSSQWWPAFRNEQRKLMEQINHSGMAVSSDLGLRDNVHPTNKKLVGYRLAQWALNKSYFKKVVPSGPLPLKAKYLNGKVVVYFNYSKDGLFTADKGELKGFSLDGIQDAVARMHHNFIEMNTPTKPTYVFYGWKPYSDGNLVNKAGLPASTFKLKVE